VHTGVAVTLWTYIREVLGSNPSRDTGYPDRGLIRAGKWRINVSIRSITQLVTGAQKKMRP
jgi:hypothetical protein